MERTIDIKHDSKLKKLYLIKEDFLIKHNIEKWNFYRNTWKSEFLFSFNKRGMGLRTKDKIEINKFLKSYGLKPYKNTISLFKIKYDNMQKVAFNILQHYQSFFKPIWYENDKTLNNYSSFDSWYILSYSNIEHKSSDFLIVDSYSTDLLETIILNFLDYIFNFGTLEDIDFFEKCLKQKEYSKNKRVIKSLEEQSRINDWKKQQILKSMRKNKSDTIKDTLQNMECEIKIKKYMSLYIKESEIKNIITKNCDYFYNLNDNYQIEDIEKKLFIDLYNLDRNKYIKEMEKIDKTKLSQTYHDKYNSIKYIAFKIQYFIDIFNSLTMPNKK